MEKKPRIIPIFDKHKKAIDKGALILGSAVLINSLTG